MVGFVLNLAAILTWADRRQSAMIQDRIGPNRAVIKIFGKEFRLAGLLHPAADGLKFFTKEDFMPPKADKLLFMLAPILAMGMVFTLVGDDPVRRHGLPARVSRPAARTSSRGPPCRAGASARRTRRTAYFPIDLQIAPLDVGILYVFAMAGQGIIGAAIAGWSSDNKFSLMGALRAASQMVSYEVTLGMSLVGAMMIYGTVRLDDMVRWQGEHAWGIFVQPLAFFLFFTAAVAENKRIPFDLPEAESELVSGYFTEYSGMKFGMFYFAEYAEVVTGSMLLVTIFLGGWALPFFHRDGLTIAFGDVRAPARVDPAPLDDAHRRARVLRQGARRVLGAGVRPLDAAALPLRPAHEARLARAPAAVAREHPGHGRRLARARPGGARRRATRSRSPAT